MPCASSTWPPTPPGYVGETTYVLEHSRRGRIVGIEGATIETTSCDPVVLAHELGHALGYPDVDERGDIMCWSNACAPGELP